MREQILTKEAKELFPKFSRFENFYLAGGTALALQIGHRISVDFDFFSEKELPVYLLQKVKRIFADIPIKVTYKDPKQQLNILLNGIKTTFFYYPYPVIKSPVKYQGVPVATIFEIAAMKAFSIGKRLSYKDYVDWYFLLSEGHITLQQVIKIANKKFGGDFNARLFLGQLVSISDVPSLEIDFFRDAVDRKTIKNFLEKTVRDFKIKIFYEKK